MAVLQRRRCIELGQQGRKVAYRHVSLLLLKQHAGVARAQGHGAHGHAGGLALQDVDQAGHEFGGGGVGQGQHKSGIGQGGLELAGVEAKLKLRQGRARGVGVKPWPSRRIKSSPKRSRNRRMALLTAGWVKAILWAARVRLRSAITSSKMRSRFRSRVRKLT